MRRVLLTIGWLFSAGPVFALSCVQPNVADSFREAVAASEDYVVVYGILKFDDRLKPEPDFSSIDAEGTKIPARLEGKALNKSGFRADFMQDVTLDLACFGPWCGDAKSGVKYLAFLRKSGSEYVFTADPCGSWAFQDASRAQLEQARQCMRGNCPASQ